VETVDKVTALRAVAHHPDVAGFLQFYRERFIMALAQRYCDGGISWEEYVRTCEVVDIVLREIAESTR